MKRSEIMKFQMKSQESGRLINGDSTSSKGTLLTSQNS